MAGESDAPAVIACHRALDLLIGTSDPSGRARYRAAQAWYRRHALRQAAEGGLFPDLFIRRLSDDIELSWSATAPLFAPNDFIFVIEPGHARLPVADVGGPLWEALQRCASQPPALGEEADRRSWRALCDKIEAISRLTDVDLDKAHVARRFWITSAPHWLAPGDLNSQLRRLGRLSLTSRSFRQRSRCSAA